MATKKCSDCKWCRRSPQHHHRDCKVCVNPAHVETGVRRCSVLRYGRTAVCGSEALGWEKSNG